MAKAVANVNELIAPALIVSVPATRLRHLFRFIGSHILLEQGLDPTQQTEVDEKMIQLDGTDNKAKLGANAILAVSLAVAKVGSACPDHPSSKTEDWFTTPRTVQAGAAEKGVPLYKHLADLAGNPKLVSSCPVRHAGP